MMTGFKSRRIHF